MEQIVAANYFSLGIGQEGVGKSHLLSMAAIDLGRVHANRDDTNPTRLKLGKPLLETPQLGVAEWSPESPIKDEDNCVWVCRRFVERRG